MGAPQPALVFCKKCKHFLRRHTSGDRCCAMNRPVPIYCRAPQGRAAVRSHVQRAPCRSSSGRCGCARPWWTSGALSWWPGAVRDLHERSGLPPRRGDRRLDPVFPHRAHPAELSALLQQRAVGRRRRRRDWGPAVGERAQEPSGGERAGGWLCPRPRCAPVGPRLSQGRVACVAARRRGHAAQARSAATQRARARLAGRPGLGASFSAVFCGASPLRTAG